jgi:hypothetical protein
VRVPWPKVALPRRSYSLGLHGFIVDARFDSCNMDCAGRPQIPPGEQHLHLIGGNALYR